MYDLKAAQRNMQYSLIRELMFKEFEQDHNAEEAPKKFIVRKEKELLITVK